MTERTSADTALSAAASAHEAASAALRDRPPQSYRAVLWYDTRDRIWRGLVPNLSLFAQAESAAAVGAKLSEQVTIYLKNANEQGLADELVPRPLPRGEWWRLRAYLLSLDLRSRMARLLGRNGPPPVRLTRCRV